MQDRVSAGRDMGKQTKTTAASYWWACKSGCSQFGAEIFLLLRAKTCRRHPLQGRICCLRENYSPLPVLGPLSLRAELLGGRVFSSHTLSSQEVRFGHRARQHMSALFSVPLKTIPGGRREVKAPLLPGHSPGAVTRGSTSRPQPWHPLCSRSVPLAWEAAHRQGGSDATRHHPQLCLPVEQVHT